MEQEIEGAIKKRTFVGKVVFYTDQILIILAVLGSMAPLVAQTFGQQGVQKAAAIAALAPTIVLFVRGRFRLKERADWQWEYRRKLISIQRQMKYQQLSDADASVLVSQLDEEMAGTYPGADFHSDRDEAA